MVAFLSMPIEKLTMELNDNLYENGTGRQNPATILPVAVTVGLLTFLVSDSLKGGMTGVQGFLVGVIATFIIFFVLALPSWLVSSWGRVREGKLPSMYGRQGIDGGLSGIPPSGSVGSTERLKMPASYIEIVCPNCNKRIEVDIHISHEHLHPPD
jgi:hypothetical protein